MGQNPTDIAAGEVVTGTAVTGEVVSGTAMTLRAGAVAPPSTVCDFCFSHFRFSSRYYTITASLYTVLLNSLVSTDCMRDF